MADLVTIVDPPRMNLLGLLLGNIIQRNLDDQAKLARFNKLAGAVEVHAGEMCVTLSFGEGQLRVSRDPVERPRATVSGSMNALMGMALGGGMVGPWLMGHIKTRGSLWLLLQLKPLLAAE